MLSPTTNFAAMVAKRNLNENSLQATRSIAKVSQGTRIVKPMDDATSLAISNTMRTSLAGMNQGIRNTTQGSALLQVAAGGLEQTSQMLTRMKQLAVQVINDTLGAAEISYANEEFGQLMQQIDSTAEQTRFSGKSLLTGGSADTNYEHTGRTALFPNANINAAGVNTTAFEGTINTTTSSGFLNHTFPSDIADIGVEVLDNEVRVNFGGEYFKGSTALQADGQLVLTSEADENNVVSFDLGADISSIRTNTDIVLHLKQFLRESEIRIGETKTIELHSDNITHIDAANNTFGNPLLDLSRTRGIINGTVAQPSDITVEGTPGTFTVTMVIDQETFRSTGVAVSPGEVMVLTNSSDPGTQFGIRYHPSDVTGLTATNPALPATDAEQQATNLQTALRETFIVRTDDPAFTTAASEFLIPDFANTADRNNFVGDFSGQISEVTVTDTAGAVPYTLSLKIGNETFRAENFQSIANEVVTLVSTSNSNNQFSLTVGAVNMTAGQASIQTELETLFTDNNNNNVPTQLLVSGSEFKIGDSERVFNDYSDSTDNGFAGFNNLYSKGYIDGIAQSILVEGKREGPYDIILAVGNQTFVQRAFDPKNAGNLTLVSESDTQNVISYTLGTGGAKNNLDTIEEFRAAVEQLFGLNKLNPSAPAKFRSASAANHAYNGVSMGNNKTILAGTATKPGTYAVSYDADTQTAKLTNGASFYEIIIEPNKVVNGKVTVSFGNGVNLQFGDDTNKFDIDASLSQMTFEVSQNDVVQLEFQVSDISRDDMSINMTAATTEALRLSGSTINGKDLARNTQDKIDLAITAINTGLANIGAQQSRFEFVRVNLTIQMENTTAARATYYDVDMGGEITEFTKYQTLTQAATSMLSQANELPQELLRLLP